MTKVPPKIKPATPRPRSRRAEETRGRKPGQTETPEEELFTDMLTMGERLEQEKSSHEDNHLWRQFEVAEDDARRREERHDDELAQRGEARKLQPALPKKEPGSRLPGEPHRPKSQEELRAELNRRVASGVDLSDGFELKPMVTPGSADPQSAAKATISKALAPPPPAPEPRLGGGGFGAAMKFLNDAKEPGHYFRMGQGDEQGPLDAEVQRELDAAVEEARQLLGGLRGIEQIEAGRDHEEQPVVLVLAGRGFCESSMSAIPEQVHRFRTVVGVAYDLLPLRRI